MDIVDKIMSYEEGDMSEEEQIQFFQELVNNGMAWTLQGCYGRNAKAMIQQGLIKEKR